jgi:Holliday junction DNA helicase RuvA
LIDVQGVGYEILASTNTLSDLQSLINQEIIVWIHTHVREDAFQLFGFHSKEEKNMFLSLLKVNGVGPKGALGILSGARVPQILEMIESGNAKALSTLPKVGKKTAEQIVLTLKGKLVIIEKNERAQKPQSIHPEIVSALVNLGYKPVVVEQFVATLPKDADIEDGVRRGLAALSTPL